jgi:lipopolysaccharide export system protein LptC
MLNPTPVPPVKAPRTTGHSALTDRWRNPRESLTSAYRYSCFVKFMKGILPAIALGVIAALLFFASQHRDPSRYSVTFAGMGPLQNDRTMIHPHLVGSDDQGAPFSLTAETAVQDDPKAMRVTLSRLSGDFTLTNGSKLNLVATSGVLDVQEHTLVVTRGTQLKSADGYEVRTLAAQVDIKGGIVKGNERVYVTGPSGHLEADSFVADKVNKRAVFRGHVRMLLNPRTTGAAR